MSERNYYVISDDNCKFPAMTKEETLAAIVEAVEQGTVGDIDTGFITTIKEMNKNTGLKFWVGTQAEYNALSPKPNNTFCIITNDSAKESIEASIENLQITVENMQAAFVGRKYPNSTGGEIFNDYSNNEASGMYSSTRGGNNINKGRYSDVCGANNTNYARHSNVSGYKNVNGSPEKTDTTGADTANSATVEGDGNTNTGHVAHVEGIGNTNSGRGAHVEGYHNIGNADYQHVQGKFNEPDSTKAFIIGNGTDESHRSNAFFVGWDGVIGGSMITLTGNALGANEAVLHDMPAGFTKDNCVVISAMYKTNLDSDWQYKITNEDLEVSIGTYEGLNAVYLYLKTTRNVTNGSYKVTLMKI